MKTPPQTNQIPPRPHWTLNATFCRHGSPGKHHPERYGDRAVSDFSGRLRSGGSSVDGKIHSPFKSYCWRSLPRVQFSRSPISSLEAEYPFLRIHILGIQSIRLLAEETILTRLHKVGERFPELHNYAPQLQCWPESGLNGLVEMRKQLQPGLALVYSCKVKPKANEWIWEALYLREFHPSIALFSGRIVNQDNIVVAGGEQFAAGRLVTCPDYGKAADDPGRFALSLKERSVGAVDSDFFIAEGSFLETFLGSLPYAATMAHLGTWLGAEAAISGQRVAYSPLISGGGKDSSYSKRKIIDREQMDAIKERYPFLRALERSAFPRYSFAGLVMSGGLFMRTLVNRRGLSKL